MLRQPQTDIDPLEQELDEIDMLRSDIKAATDNGDDRRAAELIAYLQLVLPMSQD